MIRRLRRSFPPLIVALVGGMVWAAIMAVSATIALYRSGWEDTERFVPVVSIFAIGAAPAFAVGYAIARLLAPGRGMEARLAAALISFTVATLALTAIVYALHYRLYYAQWHDTPFTPTWFIQLAFTTAGALGQFAVTGVRLYFPLGFVSLLVASCWFALRAR